MSSNPSFLDLTTITSAPCPVCGERLRVRQSNTATNPGRWFFSHPSSRTRCKFFSWRDAEMLQKFPRHVLVRLDASASSSSSTKRSLLDADTVTRDLRDPKRRKHACDVWTIVLGFLHDNVDIGLLLMRVSRGMYDLLHARDDRKVRAFWTRAAAAVQARTGVAKSDDEDADSVAACTSWLELKSWYLAWRASLVRPPAAIVDVATQLLRATHSAEGTPIPTTDITFSWRDPKKTLWYGAGKLQGHIDWAAKRVFLNNGRRQPLDWNSTTLDRLYDRIVQYFTDPIQPSRQFLARALYG